MQIICILFYRKQFTTDSSISNDQIILKLFDSAQNSLNINKKQNYNKLILNGLNIKTLTLVYRVTINNILCFFLKGRLYLKKIIAKLYGFNIDNVEQVQKRVIQLLPYKFKKLKFLFNYIDYPMKQWTTLFLFNFANSNLEIQNKLRLATAIQCVNLANCLHEQLKSGKKNQNNLWMKIIFSFLKQKYFVLVGDYFHIKASILSSSTNFLSIPITLSKIQYQLSKYAFLKQQLFKKAIKQGYSQLTLKDISDILMMKISPLIQSLIAGGLLQKDKNLNIISIQKQQIHLNNQNYIQLKLKATKLAIFIALKQQLNGLIANFFKLYNVLKNKDLKGWQNHASSIGFYTLKTIFRDISNNKTEKNNKKTISIFLESFSKNIELFEQVLRILQKQLRLQMGDRFEVIMQLIKLKMVMYKW